MIDKLNTLITPGAMIRALSEPVFRVLTSLIFIIGGLGHFGQHQMMLDRMDQSPWKDWVIAIGDPSVLLWMSGAIFIIFGFLLALGFLTRLSALVLFLTLIPITISIHIAPGHVGPLFKNIAILGALFYMWANGPSGLAIDNIRAKNHD